MTLVGSSTENPSITQRLAAYGPTALVLSGFFAALGTIFLVLFFALEAPGLLSSGTETWTPLGRTNDALIGLAALVAIAAAFRLHQSWGTRAAGTSRVALVIGLVALLGVGIIQLPFAAGLISSAIAGPLVTVGLGGIGVWVFLVSLGRADQALNRTLRWIGIVTGVGYVLLPVAFFAAGGSGAIEDPQALFQSPFLIIAFTASVLSSQIGYPIWAIWLGRRLLADRRPGWSEAGRESTT